LEKGVAGAILQYIEKNDQRTSSDIKRGERSKRGKEWEGKGVQRAQQSSRQTTFKHKKSVVGGRRKLRSGEKKAAPRWVVN